MRKADAKASQDPQGAQRRNGPTCFNQRHRCKTQHRSFSCLFIPDRTRICERLTVTETMETTDLTKDGSQDTFVSEPSLVQLDPSPIESPNVDEVTSDEKELRLLPEDEEDALPDSLKSSRTGTTTSSVGLSGTGRSAIYYCSCSALQTKTIVTFSGQANNRFCLIAQ